MQLAAPTRVTTPATPPAAWTALELGPISYAATLTHNDLVERDDADGGWEQVDRVRWHEAGTSAMRTAGVLGAREGYATLAQATAALQALTDDALTDAGVEDLISAHDSRGLRSARAGGVLEHDGRFYGYALDRDFQATEAFQVEPQVEDGALFDGVTYDVTLSATTATNPNLRAIVDGYAGVWTLRG